MTRRFPCPACAKPMLLEKVHEGFEVPCPACGERFLVAPGSTDEPPEPPEPPRSAPSLDAPVPPPLRYGRGSEVGQENGTVALVFGLVGVIAFPLVSPVAWILGHRARAASRAAGREPSSSATAGWVLGMVGTGILLMAGCFVAFVVAAMIGKH